MTDACIELAGDDTCTGCSGCANSCAADALEVRLNSEGFYRAKLDKQNCDYCGQCEEACPVLAAERGTLPRSTWRDPKVYAGWSTDAGTHLKSSSGGAFSELASIVIQNKGMVFGCVWDKNLEPEHKGTESLSEVHLMRGSKYVPSRMGKSLSEAARFARQGKQVLFSGAPCQVAALSLLLDPMARRNVILVDFICHGVPSLSLFSSYKNWLFDGEAIRAFTFRDKSMGLQTIHAESNSGRTYTRRASEDPFFRLGYGNHLSMMSSCFDCKFSTLPRVADITLGDFWGVPKELDHPKGVSLIMVNSPIGERLMSAAVESGSLSIEAADLATAAKMNPRARGGVWQSPRRRHEFMNDVALGRSFFWLYWRWYLPIRSMEMTKAGVLDAAVWLVHATKVKKVLQHLRGSSSSPRLN